MRKLPAGLLIFVFSLSAISMYGYYDISVSYTENQLPPFIQVQYEPTPAPTPVQQSLIDVTVIDALTKEPIAGARVEVHTVENVTITGHTNAQGNVSTTHTWTVSYFQISADGYDTLVVEAEPVGVFELVVTVPDTDNYYEISGGVTDADTGEPLEGVGIYFRSYHNEEWDYTNTTTDASGYYSITAYTGTTATLNISKGSYSSDTATVEPGIHTIDFVLEKAPPGTGDVWIFPASQTVSLLQKFTVEIHANTGNQKLAAYGFEVVYSSGIISLQTGVGTDGAVAGTDGFVAATDAVSAGTKIVSGFDTKGTGPGSDLHIVTIHFYARAAGTSTLKLVVNALSDQNTATIGIPQGIDGTVTVSKPAMGDVNRDDIINIVDALLVAQYYVSRDQSILDVTLAEVNGDGTVDIIDALLIARYDVGLISYF